MNSGIERGLPSRPDPVAIVVIVDGSGAVITTGVKGSIQIPFAHRITDWSILCDASGSIVFDLWRSGEAQYPPTVANSVVGHSKPTVASATRASSASLNGWQAVGAAGDVYRVNVDSATTVKLVTLTLTAVRL